MRRSNIPQFDTVHRHTQSCSYGMDDQTVNVIDLMLHILQIVHLSDCNCPWVKNKVMHVINHGDPYQIIPSIINLCS
jgi:hypothetical protein